MSLHILGGSSHKQFTRAICDYLGIVETKSTSKLFSNGNRFVSIDEPVRGHDVYVIQTQSPPVDGHVMELLIYIRTLRDASAARITAVLPYFPYARSDKRDQPRVCITARLLADLLAVAGADRVITMEMHSPQIQGFFSIHCDQLLAAPDIIRHLRTQWTLHNYCLVAGDAGAAKMLKRYADHLGLPVAIMDKRREGNQEQVSIKGVIGDVAGKKVLLLDDETSTGRTLIRDAEYLLQSAGAQSVDACFIHAALDQKAADRLNDSPIERFLTTDTIPCAVKLRNCEIVSVTERFAECIKHIHDSQSIELLNNVIPLQN
ncbi:MAG: ribose-phosphate pyrophosphokinase [Candidatus Magasanikbacteria bacterium]|nr:ribose-phosphate pyrophosphokinase [Candidatus Magasanikbacteria bacterium]